MITFTRGLDPRVAMGVDVEKCSHCHKILTEMEKQWISESLCQKCLDILYPAPKLKMRYWNRLTILSKTIAISIIGFIIWFICK